MASEKILEQKKQQVLEMADKIKNSCAGVVVDYSGISVADDTVLRRELRDAGIEYKVIKNSILGRAIEAVGLQGVEASVFEGNSAIAMSKDDYVAAARILNKFSASHDNFKLKTGYIDGEVISLEKLSSLAKLPGRDVLLATVCSAFNAPIAAFARVLQAIVDKDSNVVTEVTE